jgi:hypothetical protein
MTLPQFRRERGACVNRYPAIGHCLVRRVRETALDPVPRGGRGVLIKVPKEGTTFREGAESGNKLPSSRPVRAGVGVVPLANGFPAKLGVEFAGRARSSLNVHRGDVMVTRHRSG